eukprot:3984309-Pyramimonas_sp.AAC.1
MEGGPLSRCGPHLSAPPTLHQNSQPLHGWRPGSFQTCGTRPSAADIRLQNLQRLRGWRAAGFRSVALALAPCTFVLKDCSS